MLDYGYCGLRRPSSPVDQLRLVAAVGRYEHLEGRMADERTRHRPQRLPFSVFDCTNAVYYCMRAEDPIGIDRNVTSGTPTGNPNEFTLLDLTPLQATAGRYVNPITGNTDFGPYPADMTKRDEFRGPGAWNIDYAVGKRFRFGNDKAVMTRLEVYNLFNHHNMYLHGDTADISSGNAVTGYPR